MAKLWGASRAPTGFLVLLTACGNGASGGTRPDAGTGGPGGASAGATSGTGGETPGDGNAGAKATLAGGSGSNAGGGAGVGGSAGVGAGGGAGVGGSTGAGGSGGATGPGGASGSGGSGAAGAGGSGGTLQSGGTTGNGGKAGGGAGGSIGAGGKPPGSGGGGGAPSSCLSAPLLNALGKTSVLVGASMADATATSGPFDMRYEYLSGGLFDGASPCQRCDTGCTTKGKSCANSAGGCSWWGCWQYDQDPPGAYTRGFFATDKTNGQIPMITYYQALQASGAAEGSAEVAAMNDAAFMGRYLSDFRFLVDQIGTQAVFLHIEPDFWGYAEQVNQDPHSIKAAVATAYPGCSSFENSIAGLGRCMIDIAHKNAPNAKIGLHGSGWATKIDVLGNKDANLNVAGEAKKLGTFLSACGAGDSDFVVVDASDRDAAWYATQGRDTWWDDTNATLPNFHQAFAWAKALAESVGKPVVWWQLPVGNGTLPNTSQAWKDNRVDYFMSHLDEVSASHGVAILFGAGDGNQTTPETDGGHLVDRVKQYASAGRTKACP